MFEHYHINLRFLKDVQSQLYRCRNTSGKMIKYSKVHNVHDMIYLTSLDVIPSNPSLIK